MAERRPLVLSGNNVSELPQTDTLPGVQVLHGWPFPYEVSLSYDKTTRQVTITPTGATFAIWVGGVKFVKSGAQTSTAHPAASDQHFLYYNTSGELEWSTTPWDMKVVSPVCEVYYDTIPADGYALFELHTYKRNPEWHESQHSAIGTFVRTGLEISGFTLNAEGNAAVTFQVAAGTIVDEDIEFAINSLADGGPYTLLRRSGASGYTWDNTSAVPYLSGATWIQYNQLVTGSWQMTEAGAANRWVNYYLYATTALDANKRIFLVPGQALFTTLASAQAESNASLNLTGLGLSEFVCVWKLTFQTANGYTATGRVRLVEVNRITNTRGALSVNLTTTNHALLTGRETADAHPASAITNTPAGNIAATTVQAAINELDAEKQPLDATLTALAGVTTAADKLIYATASDAFATTDLSSYARTLIDDTTASAARTTLGLGTAATMAGPTGAIVGTTDIQVLSNKTATDLSLSAISATLHRSPNAITAMFVYDTSKDSDGGAWTEKCQHASWYQETLSGRWLGAQVSESAARAVSGATTGDYFQLTTDGKFYSLSAGSGTTEVFRGNKRSFPKLAAIVASAANVDVYDLTEAGRPMWARYPNTGAMATGNIAALAAVNGRILVGGASGLATLNFATDRLMLRNATNLSAQAGLATIRVNAQSVEVGTALANAAIADIAVTVLPDAPEHPDTGLKMPTVALATGARVVVIRNDGTLVNSSSTSAFTQVTLSPQLLSAGRADAVWYYAPNPNSMGSSFSLSTKNANTAPDFNVGNTAYLKAKNRASMARSSGAGYSPLVQFLRNHEGTIAKGIASKLSDTYNTGWMVGDIRRVYLAGIASGSMGPVSDLAVNGSFDTDTSSNWVSGSNATSISVASNELTWTSTANSSSAIRATFGSVVTVVAGKAYRLTCSVKTITASLSKQMYIRIYDSAGNILSQGATVTASNAPTQASVSFVAGANPISPYIYALSAATGDIFAIDNLSVNEIAIDYSYNAAVASIGGSLTATAVNLGNSLVACSGFSAANYVQEAYSAQLDFGTGEWTCSAWVNIPAGNAAAGTIVSRAHSTGPYITLGIDATNKLTATASDGTTTRTVTSSAAYDTATWLKVRANYTTDGKLALLVNGVEVASATGTALLTLNNSNAVLTIGNSYALDAPFPGSIALLKLSASVPTAEQALFMYEQEKHLFSAGAKCVLPASTSVLDLAYDDATDTWSTLQATYESSFSGLVRTSTQAPSAGSFSRVTAASGVKLLGRTTTNPGVDVRMPVKNLLPKDMPVGRNQDIVVFDFDAVTGQTDFVLPEGYTARVVYSAGSQQREGSTKAWVRVYDGFRETIRFGAAPGNEGWVQIHAVRAISEVAL